MSDIAFLIVFTLIAWLIHGGLAQFYSRKFAVKSWRFRALHGTEIALTTGVMLTLYQVIVEPSLATLAIICTVLGTLVVVDGVLLTVSSKLRGMFDAWHFVAAYAAVSIAVGCVSTVFF